MPTPVSDARTGANKCSLPALDLTEPVRREIYDVVPCLFLAKLDADVAGVNRQLAQRLHVAVAFFRSAARVEIGDLESSNRLRQIIGKIDVGL